MVQRVIGCAGKQVGFSTGDLRVVIHRDSDKWSLWTPLATSMVHARASYRMRSNVREVQQLQLGLGVRVGTSCCL